MRFGRAHAILTSSLAAFGILALVGSVPLPGLAPAQVVAELLIGGQLVALATRRGARHDGVIFVLALVHFLMATLFGGGLAFLLAFVGLALVLPAALVLSHLRREVEGNYHQGARDRTGLPVDVPRILRSRRVMGDGSLVALGSLSLPILGMTALLFIVLPRLGVSPRGTWLSGFALDPREGLVHFTDSVDLGHRSKPRPDQTVALRFRVAELPAPPPRMPLRFRGAVLDQFDGRVFARTQGPPAATLPAAPASIALTRAVTIERESFDPPVSFVPSGTLALRALDTGDDGAPPRRYIAYVATEPGHESAVLDEALSAAERSRDLALPPSLPKRITELAHAWADPEPTASAKARAIEQHLRKDLAYELGSSSLGTEQPIDHFLFESKRGHCELFATAMTMMLRAVGIPAREVTGFVGGTYNRFGDYYMVRQADAHAWVEAHVTDGAQGGWRTFDPTPSSTPLAPDTGVFASTRDLGDAFSRRYGSEIASYDGRSQSAIVEALRAPLAIAAGLVVAALVILGVRRGAARGGSGASRGGAPAGGAPLDADAEAAAALYSSLESALVAQGIVRDRSLPPLAHAEHLAKEQHPLADVVVELTRLYLEARFGGRPITRSTRRHFEQGISRIASFQRA